MVPMADLRVHTVVVDAAAEAGGAVAAPRGSEASGAEVRTVALLRHLLGRPSERAFLAEPRRDWRASFPARRAQGGFGRRGRWPRGDLREEAPASGPSAPADPCQRVDTLALPVKPASAGCPTPLPPWPGRGGHRRTRPGGRLAEAHVVGPDQSDVTQPLLIGQGVRSR
jgi:hypothetical protein